MNKTKTLAAVLCFAAVGLTSCKQGGADILVTDLKIADQNIPGTYASQVDDSVAMCMTVYEYSLNEDGTGNYKWSRPYKGLVEDYTESFTWKRGELSEDLLSIPITLSPTGKVVKWANGSIVDDVTTCSESAKLSNYEKILNSLPRTSWEASDTVWFINVLHLDSMSYAWKNQKDTLTQAEITSENEMLAANADEIREALGMAPTDPVEVNVLKDLGNGEFQVIYPHYVGTVIKYDYPDTLGLKSGMKTSVSFLYSDAEGYNGLYTYASTEYKLNADSTDVIPVKIENEHVSYKWYISQVSTAKKFNVKAVTDDDVINMLISGFDKAKGTLDYNGLTYKLLGN